jgi:hypothetical protein
VEEQRRGFISLSLTNWTNTNEPLIAEGSRIEISNALYSFAGDEDIDQMGLVCQ